MEKLVYGKSSGEESGAVNRFCVLDLPLAVLPVWVVFKAILLFYMYILYIKYIFCLDYTHRHCISGKNKNRLFTF